MGMALAGAEQERTDAGGRLAAQRLFRAPVRTLEAWLESERERWFNWVPVCLGLASRCIFGCRASPV